MAQAQLWVWSIHVIYIYSLGTIQQRGFKLNIMQETAGMLPSSVQSVISNDDLLKEILVRLPLLSLVLLISYVVVKEPHMLWFLSLLDAETEYHLG